MMVSGCCLGFPGSEVSAVKDRGGNYQEAKVATSRGRYCLSVGNSSLVDTVYLSVSRVLSQGRTEV